MVHSSPKGINFQGIFLYMMTDSDWLSDKKIQMTYNIIPPNTAHTLKIKLDENPLGTIRFFVDWQCSVTDILILKWKKIHGFTIELFTPEGYQSNFLSNYTQT